ncbi:recombinase family protein [Paenibacillus albicereus]|uniref:Recombinase family protein n=1 Tax=Paenibacillus albicereus TaxID=2726185 RepID=A0A6H2GZ62_9BACL|nr:recombinase family protein [Paenibacillus albicereus]QJC52724.1 recombinase family protein [Paenibacillus albicereus]
MIGIYVRVSTEEQAKNGYSIKDQIRQCKNKAKGNDVLEYIDEGYSGEFLERPALEKLRNDVRDGVISTVIVYDPDRWSRNLMNQLIITEEIEKRAKLVFVNSEYEKSPEGRLFYQIRGAVSEFEKAKITERMGRGRKEKARQGKVVKNSQLYGYNFNTESSMYEIHPDESKVVKMIFDLFTLPDSPVKGINGIANFLTSQGVPTKRGAPVWHRQVVRQILLNQSYVGNYFQNRWNTEGMLGNKYRDPDEKIPMRERPESEWIELSIPPIIEEVQFARAQQLIGESKRRFAKEGLRKYLLSGLVRCGECENTMTGLRAKHWGKHKLEYSDTKNFSGAKFKGCGMRISCEKLDEEVWQTVLAWLTRSDHQTAAAEEVARPDRSLEELEFERIEKEIEKVGNRRKNLIKLFAEIEDEIGQSDIRNELRDLAEKEKQMKSNLEQLQVKMGNQKSREFTKQAEDDLIAHYLSKDLDNLSFEDKQEIIRSLVREVRVYKGERVDIYGF